MQVYEFEAKTAEDAIQEACARLHLSRDEMDIEVIEPGSAGIFGLVGGRKARIKVTLQEKEPEAADEGLVEKAEEALKTLLALIPINDVTVRAENREGAIILDIEGDKSGLLIGRKGKTLDAIQYILNKIINKDTETKTQVIVDSENYRQRRRDSLIEMSLRMGDKAKRIKKPVSTELLNAHDRRIIHLALKDDPELDTKSRGEGLLKKVVIIPKR